MARLCAARFGTTKYAKNIDEVDHLAELHNFKLNLLVKVKYFIFNTLPGFTRDIVKYIARGLSNAN